MNEEHISTIQSLLTEWNPLGNRSAQVKDLNNYKLEAIDILFYIDKRKTVGQISKMVNTVLNEAFLIEVEPDKCKNIAEQIHTMFRDKTIAS